jgi:hypothetical protein
MVARANLRAMRSRRALAASTLAVGALAVGALAGATVDASAAVAGDSDGGSGDKNVLLAEAQFLLFLLNANFLPTDITCTHPPVRDVAGDLLCYALISERVSVAAIATMEEPGTYTYLPLNKVDPADLAADVTATGEPPAQPGHRKSTADQAVVASIDSALADAEGLGRVLTDNNPSIRVVDVIGYHAPTSTVQVTVTTDAVDAATRDGIAFYVTDVMAFLWAASEPARARDATLHPRLEVTVDGVIYGTPFDVMSRVADYTISEGEWLAIVTGNADAAPAVKAAVKPVSKVTGKTSPNPTPAGAGVL